MRDLELEARDVVAVLVLQRDVDGAGEHHLDHHVELAAVRVEVEARPQRLVIVGRDHDERLRVRLGELVDRRDLAVEDALLGVRPPDQRLLEAGADREVHEAHGPTARA
ncbi:hypothetical protein [Methylobacterium gregans]|uniref:hypothetical protein n=1 Tax=Methylobacterium gregans TaxID=374424 RepID=UPI0036178542